MKCIIKEKITLGSEVPWPAWDMARIRQEPPPKMTRTVRYVNTDTHEEYLCLAGGFAWPGIKPGYAVVVAVQQTEDEDTPLLQDHSRGRGIRRRNLTPENMGAIPHVWGELYLHPLVMVR